MSTDDADLDPATLARYFAEDFACILRNLLRALAASDASGSLATASRDMRQFEKNLNDPRTPADLNWYKIFDGAVSELKDSIDSDSYHGEFVELARACVKYLAELSTSDNLSGARISKAHGVIAKEIEELLRRRTERRTGLD